MRFWDASAIVPLVVEEAESKACRHLLRTDGRVVVWAHTRVEITSALCRQHRDGGLSREDLRGAEARLEQLARRWSEVDDLTLAREQAERLLHIHALRAEDALQLGAALLAVDHRPRRRRFVAIDDRLLIAAEREGFHVLRPKADW